LTAALRSCFSGGFSGKCSDCGVHEHSGAEVNHAVVALELGVGEGLAEVRVAANPLEFDQGQTRVFEHEACEPVPEQMAAGLVDPEVLLLAIRTRVPQPRTLLSIRGSTSRSETLLNARRAEDMKTATASSKDTQALAAPTSEADIDFSWAAEPKPKPVVRKEKPAHKPGSGPVLKRPTPPKKSLG
jgi:hypothetical protein